MEGRTLFNLEKDRLCSRVSSNPNAMGLMLQSFGYLTNLRDFFFLFFLGRTHTTHAPRD